MSKNQARGTKNNGKGRKPDDVLIGSEGRNAFGYRHVAILLQSADGFGNPWNVINIRLEDVPIFAASLKDAVQQAQTAPDTTPDKYKAKFGIQETAPQAPGTALPSWLTPEMLTMLQAMSQGQVPAPQQASVPAPQPTQQGSPLDDLAQLGNALQAPRTTSRRTRTTNKK